MAKLSKILPEGCNRSVLLRWTAWLLLLLMALLPSHGLTSVVPVSGVMLEVCWGVSFSAGKYGLAWMGLLMVLLIQPRWAAIPALLLPVLLLIGSGAWLNEHVLKPAIAEPRPSVSFLASAAAGPVLEEGVDAFYALPDKSSAVNIWRSSSTKNRGCSCRRCCVNTGSRKQVIPSPPVMPLLPLPWRVGSC